MSSKQAKNSRPEVPNAGTFSAYIAKARKIAVKIRHFNDQLANQYRIQPALVLVPFVAGIAVAGLFMAGGRGDGGAMSDLSVNKAGFGVLSTGSEPSGNMPGNDGQLLLAQADAKPAESEPDEDLTPDKIELSEEMKAELSPEEIAVFEMFTQLAEVQAEKGDDSPEAKALSSKLDVAIGAINAKQEKEQAEESAKEAAQAAVDAAALASQPAPVVKSADPNAAAPVRSNVRTGSLRPGQPPRPAATETNTTSTTDAGPTPKPVTSQPKPETRAVTTPVSQPVAQPVGRPAVSPVAAPVSTPAGTPAGVPAVTGPVRPAVVPGSNAGQVTAVAAGTEPVSADAKEVKEAGEDVLPEGQVRIKTNDGMIDLNELLITIGKELELNYYFEDGQIPTGRVLMQQYGAIDRAELLPLLESVLAKSDYMMVKEGPYTKILKRTDIQRNTTVFTPEVDDKIDTNDNSVIAAVITLKYIKYDKVREVLEKFMPYTDNITEISNTNKIVISDYARNLVRIKEIIEMIDVAGPEKKLEILVPEYLKPDDAKTVIEDMYQKLYGEEGINTGAKSGTSGQPSTPDQPVNLAEMSAAERAEYIRNRNRDAAAAAGGAARAGNNAASSDKVAMPDITVDKRTGRIFVIGTEVELNNVKEILGLFDVAKSGPQVELKEYTPTYVDAKSVVTQIESLMKAMNDEENGSTGNNQTNPSVVQVDPATGAMRTTPVNRQPATVAPSTGGANSIPGMFVLVDERTNRIIVLGWPDQIKLFEEILALFDVTLPGGAIELEILPLENTEAADTVSKVKDLINAINKKSSGKDVSIGTDARGANQPRQAQQVTQIIDGRLVATGANNNSTEKEEDSGPFMMADERLNRIFVIGVREQIDQAKELTAMIDQQWPGSKVELKIFTFKVVEVEAIIDQITELIQALNNNEEKSSGENSSVDRNRSMATFPSNSNPAINGNGNSQSNFQQAGEEGPFLMADSRLNRLFVVGLDDQITQVDELIKILDKSIGLDLQIIPAFKYILSSDAADQMAKLLTVMHEQEESSGSTGTRNRTNNRTSNTNNNNNRNLLNDETNSLMGSNNSRNNTGSSQQPREGISAIISVTQRGPFLLPDDRTNRLLVVSTKEQYSELLSLIPILDVPPSEIDEMKIEVYQPDHVTVEDVQTILDDLGLTQSSASLDEQYRRRNNNDNNNLSGANRITPNALELSMNRNFNNSTMIGNVEEPEMSIAVHKATNRIFIYAAKYQHEEIARMIEKIDVEPTNMQGDYEVFSLKHRKPEELSDVLTKLLVDSEQQANAEMEEIKGKAVIVPVTDTPFIVVRAEKQKRMEAAKLIKSLDKPMPQVLIEANFIQVSLDDNFKLGVSLQENFRTGGTDSVSGISPMNLNSIATNSNGVAVGGGGTIAFFHDDMIHATLEALATQTNSEVTSSPRLLVNNNVGATFTSKRQKPTTKTTTAEGSGTTQTDFAGYVDAGTILTITPQIGMAQEGEEGDGKEIEDGFISLKVKINVDSFEGEGNGNIPPGKIANEIDTDILMPNGATVIMGGLTQTNWSDTVRKIPVLGDIPLVGALFRSVTKSQNKTVLYVFIKATVAFDPNKDPDFNTLKEISKTDQTALKKLRENFNGMPIIPGFEDKRVDETTDNDGSGQGQDKPADEVNPEKQPAKTEE